MNDYLEGIIRNLPDLPGCYQYLDESGTVIYVGKAKNLKRRVSSYFNREHDSKKTQMLVRKIHDIRYIVVKTNEESLLLENNLIKKYKPRYNVLLKDDKTYPSIAITTEEFPRPAPRPKNSRLDKMGLRLVNLPQMPQWQDALAEFISREFNK